MKKAIIFSTLMLLAGIFSFAQTQLSYRFANPSIVNSGSQFQFDVEVKASAAGSFHRDLQIYFDYNTLGFGTDIVSGGNISYSLLPLLSSHYSIVNMEDNTSSKVAIITEGINEGPTGGQPGSSTYFNEVTTSFQGVLQITIDISDCDALAGIQFDELLMNGGQYYQSTSTTDPIKYMDPCLYENDLLSEFLCVDGLSIISPTINTMWTQGQYYEILWQSAISPSENLRIQLYKAGSLHSTIAFSTANDGKFIWTVPAGLLDDCDYQIYIYQLSDLATNGISVPFCIGTPIVTFTNPIAGVTWQQATYYPIKWTSTLSPTEPVRLQLWREGESSQYQNLAFNTDNDGLFNWVTPGTIPDGCNFYLKIYRLSDPEQFGISKIFCFGEPSIDVVTPSKLATWNIGNYYFITWTSTLSPDIDVSIDLIKDGTLLNHLAFVTDNDGVFVWTVPQGLDIACDYQIRVTSNDVSTDFGISELFCIGPQVTDFTNLPGSEAKDIITVKASSVSLELNVYPNPASEDVFIDLQNLEGSDLKISIYDSYGKLIWDRAATEFDSRHVETYEVTHLSKGIYLVNVLNNGRFVQKKFLKY